MALGTRFVRSPGATGVVKRAAQPAVHAAGEAIAAAIPAHVPVRTGVMQASYSPTVDAAGDDVHVFPGSPFWHWMEYGTAFNPPYRPIETAVRGLGLKYEAH